MCNWLIFNQTFYKKTTKKFGYINSIYYLYYINNKTISYENIRTIRTKKRRIIR